MAGCVMSSFGVPKLGNGEPDWEDAAAHSERRGRFAVSDGAASAYQAQLWSHLLASGFLALEHPPDRLDAFHAWVARLADVWRERTSVADDAPYYIRHAQERGSHATFLGVSIDAAGRYRVLAVGDTCVFAVRDDRVRSTFPLTDPDAFGFSPDLVSTNEATSAVRHTTGQLEPGDMLVAATDATSEWLMRSLVAGDAGPTAAITAPIDAAEAAVTAAQRSGAIRNDDVAVVRCQWTGAGS